MVWDVRSRGSRVGKERGEGDCEWEDGSWDGGVGGGGGASLGRKTF